MSDKKISFSMPEQLGVMMRVIDDNKITELELHAYSDNAPNSRLTDDFLDQLIWAKKSDSKNVSFSLFTGFKPVSMPISLSFENDTMRISTSQVSYVFHISFEEFFHAFCESVKKYAMYYAAPANYRAFFHASFDDMVHKFEKYRDEENEILKKISDV